MKNIFEGAYFGKRYKTRDDRDAIYCKYKLFYGVVPNSKHSITKHLLLINNMQWVNVFDDGSTVIGKEYPNDIVSEWTEEVNDEELEKLAVEYADHAEMTGTSPDGYNTSCWDYLDIIKAFKAGCRNTLKNKIDND